jgi:hypothetical protein
MMKKILKRLGQLVALAVVATGAYLAVTCMTSAMTRNQVVAFILSVVACLFLILAGFNPVTTPALMFGKYIPKAMQLAVFAK